MTFSASNGEAWPLSSDGVATVLTTVSLPPGVMRLVSEAGLHSEIALLGKPIVWNMAAPLIFWGAKALKVLNIHMNKIRDRGGHTCVRSVGHSTPCEVRHVKSDASRLKETGLWVELLDLERVKDIPKNHLLF